MPLCVGWHLAVLVFLLGITQERCLKPYGSDLIRGGGHKPLPNPMERDLSWLAFTSEH
jgi:hypothetical protein